jgi:CRP-like cAMP-binding protein
MVAFDAGEELMHQGRLGREAFVIVSGTATVTRDDQLLADVGPGDVVGEATLLAGDHYRNATVTATSPLSALVLSWQEFASLMELPGIADTIHDLKETRRAS